MPPPDPTPSRTLLVVDDEPRVLAALKDVLERQGFHLCTSSDPLRAIELLRQREFAVVLSDHLMPSMSGMDLLVECRRIQPRATRVLITAALSLPTLVEAINKGEIYRFLAKPWLREELIATVRNALNRHELIVQNERLLTETSELNSRLATANAALGDQVKRLETQRRALDEAGLELGRRYDRSLELCSRILATYDPVLARQTQAVASIAGQMARAADFLSPEERDVLRPAAWLCDLGLIGVPRDTLHRFRTTPSALSDAERDSLHNHPVYSQTLASHLDDRSLLAEAIRSHHERFDGGGYPDGLSGHAIPLVARCLAAAVWFVESGLPQERAAAAIEAEAGRALDPTAVRLFLNATRLQTLPRPVREIGPDELRPGMVLASGIYSPHGLLLVGEGQPLNPATISKIRTHNLVDPLGPRLLVYT
jgi:response regulator RpfG family c-di-GMP phosphodiesterase